MIGDVVLHWAVVLLLGAVGLPWAKYVFATLPAAMLGMARLLGIALVGVFAWGVAMHHRSRSTSWIYMLEHCTELLDCTPCSLRAPLC